MIAATCYTCFDSPLGELCIQSDGESVTGLYLPHHRGWSGLGTAWRRGDGALAFVREQLAEYFAGTRQAFDVPLQLAGTPFQRRVWRELTQIPFGTTTTYAELARRVGKPNAVRAVGHANARNPVSIIVPCHRVIGSDGKLTGYAGGLEMKRRLLDWERRAAAGPEACGELAARRSCSFRRSTTTPRSASRRATDRSSSSRSSPANRGE